MSVDSAYSPDRGITKCLLVEESRTTKEKRLVAAAKRGCDAAFDELCRPYAKRLLATVQLFTKNRQDAVGGLRPGFQRVIQLGQFEERSVKETAQILDVTISAAKARLYRARAALRRSAALKAISRARNEPAA
jgi:hypothetical protein